MVLSGRQSGADMNGRISLPQGLRWLLLMVLCLALLLVSGCSLFKKPHGGGYYQNDGPGGITELDGRQLRDAVPRVEPLMSGPNKPYTVNGKRYTPDTREVPFTQRGVASWYGKQFHGRQTSSGEIYNMYEMTAAHTTLPIPCYVRVTNVANGRSVIVRVNDRGPFINNRIIDLSYAAAYKLDYIRQGTAQVVIERIMPADIRAGRVPQTSGGGGASGGELGAGRELSGGFFIQIGVYSASSGVDSISSRLQSWDRNIGNMMHVNYDGRYYRVYVGPYDSLYGAQTVADRIEAFVGVKPLVLDRR